MVIVLVKLALTDEEHICSTDVSLLVSIETNS